MEAAIFTTISKSLAAVLPENVQILSLYSTTDRETDIVKIGISPAGPHIQGTPFRVMDLTLAAGVRRRIKNAPARLQQIFSAIQNWIGSGRTTAVQITGVCQIDAILPTPGEAYATGTDDTEEYLVSTISAKIYATKF